MVGDDLTDAGRRARDDIEKSTDASQDRADRRPWGLRSSRSLPAPMRSRPVWSRPGRSRPTRGNGRVADLVPSMGAADLASWVRAQANGVDRFLFGVAGSPGSGKSTLAEHLGAELGAPVVQMDGFHLPNAELDASGLRDVKGAPETFDAQAFVELVGSLRDPSRPVRCPAFDRTADEPVADQVCVAPSDSVVIIEGNYLLLDQATVVVAEGAARRNCVSRCPSIVADRPSGRPAHRVRPRTCGCDRLRTRVGCCQRPPRRGQPIESGSRRPGRPVSPTRFPNGTSTSTVV